MADIERCLDGDTPGTYLPPKEGWCCFHCGVVFKIPAAARDHFGKRPDGKPLCLIKVGLNERPALMHIRELEAQIAAHIGLFNEFDRLCLVIESAVRQDQPDHVLAIHALIKGVREALTSISSFPKVET